MKGLIGCAAVFGLAGCATSNINTSSAASVPVDRVFVAEYVRKTETRGHVVVKRDTGVVGSALSARLSVDNYRTAEINPGERLDLYLEPGRHVLGLSFALGLAGDRAVAFNLAPGDEQIYRIVTDLGGTSLIAAAD